MLREYAGWTAAEMAGLVRRRQLSATELTRAALERIRATDAELGAFITVDEAGALAQAAAIDASLAKGEDPGPLAGVPVALKDNICTKGLGTSCASRMLADFVPPYDATVTERLAAAGAVLVGKTNMDEFAMGSTTESSFYGTTKNPHNTGYAPGGSSGGSAAAVAAGQVPLALGSDTGGSVRQPAAWCGVVGYKPSYGTVSRHGLVAFASSLEVIGPMARTTADAALLYRTICGADANHDATSRGVTMMADDSHPSVDGLKGLRIGYPRAYCEQYGEAETLAVVWNAMEKLEAAGARVDETELPALEYAKAAYFVLSSAEASSNLARYDGIRYGYTGGKVTDLDQSYKTSRIRGFGAEVQRRILLGTFVLNGGYYNKYYQRAQNVRGRIESELNNLFNKYDIIAMPTVHTTACKLGAYAEDPVGLYEIDRFTAPVNLAGCCAISLPCGHDTVGLPVGLQLVGPALEDERLLAISGMVEEIINDGKLL